MRTRIFPAVVLLLFFECGPVDASQHKPPSPDSALELETHMRAFWRIDEWNPMVSVDVGILDDFEQIYRSLTLGTYYRLHRNLKVGAFYRAQQGARHDDDWIAATGSFEWDDTDSRIEHLFFVDVSPRLLLPMLPGEDWVLMLKNRYFYNSYNAQQWLQIRPGLTWFRIVDRRPLLNVAASYEFYIPLNFGETVLYSHSPYLNVLYHLSQTVKLDASLAYRTRNWSTSQDVKDDPAESDYRRKVRSWVVGVGAIFQFEP